MKHLSLVTLAAVLGASAPVSPATQAFTLDDLPKIVGVADVSIAPDGKEIAFIVSHANMKADRNDRTLELYDLVSKTTRPLTYDRRRLSSPSWAPDGGTLAFLALDGDDKSPHQQIYVMDMRGGDPVPVTHASNGVEQFAWRPDGRAIAYVTPDDAFNKKEIEHHLDAFVVGDQAYNDRSAPTPNHLWIVNRDGTGVKRLTSGTWSLPSAQPPGSPGAPITWSPDGKRIAFTKMPNAYDADSDGAIVAILDVESGAVRPLTTHAKYEGFAEFSPDGRHVSYWYPNAGDPAGENDIYVVPAEGGSDGSDVSAAELDTNVQRAIWMPDGNSLLLAAHKGTDAALWIKPLAGIAKRLNLGDVQPVQAFWLDGSVSKSGSIAFAGTEPGHPPELFYMSTPASTPQRLTNYNDGIAALHLGEVRTIAWTNDGFEENGIVTLPPGYDPMKSYPLVLSIHGGPAAASISSFSSLNQLLAARGWIVFNPNYRGSDNVNAKYFHAIVKDAGAGPGRDVMAGIDAVEKAYKIDTARIGVSGWSYGGYMTSWMIGHYHIWKAAVSGAAVNNLVDEYALSDGNVQERYSFGGSPWSKGLMESYLEQSPLTYAWQITTPTLVLSDVGDARVPVTQSYEMYHSLKDHGVPVRFFAYPVAGHFPGDPVRARDVDRRWIEWLGEYLK